jgi:hypothetical protein
MAERSYNGRNLLANFNGDFESAPPFTAPTTVNGRWINGTASGSGVADDNEWKWGINSINSVTGNGIAAQFDDGAMKVSTTGTGAWCSVSTALGNTNAQLLIGGQKAIPLRQYTATFRMRTEYISGDSAAGAYGQMTFRNNAGTALSSAISTNVKTTTDWTYYTLTATAPIRTEFVNFLCSVRGNNGTATLILNAWFDDIQIQEVLPARSTATSRSTSSNRVTVRDMGTALRFDGANDFMTTPPGDFDASSGQWTVASWINTGTGSSSADRAVWRFCDNAGATDAFRLNIEVNTGRPFVWNVDSGGTGTSAVKPTKRLNDGTWKFVVVVRNSDSKYDMYVNNEKTTGTATLSPRASTNFLLGRNTSNILLGITDEVRIWNRELTSQEVSDLYFNNIVPRDSLVAEYLFNEASGTTALDTSGNGNDATISGAQYTLDVPLQLRDSI